MNKSKHIPLKDYLLLFLIEFGEAGYSTSLQQGSIHEDLNDPEIYPWGDLIAQGYLRRVEHEAGGSSVKLTTKGLELIRSNTDGHI